MNRLIKSNLLVIIVSNTTNVSNYLLQLFLAHALTPEDFGVFNAVNSLGLMTFSLVNVFVFLAGKYIIKFQDALPKQCALIRLFTRTLVIWGGLLCFGMSAFAPSFARYLNLHDIAPILLFIIWFFTFCIIGIYTGILNGFMKYVLTAIQNSIQNFLRLLFSIIVVSFLGWSYNGVLFASIMANIPISIWMFHSVLKKVNIFKIAPQALPKKTGIDMIRYALPVGLTWFAISISSNMDIVLVKHFLSASETGLYSVASLLGKVALFLPMMMISVLFPEVAKNHNEKKSSIKTLVVTLGLSIAMSGIYTFAVYLNPELIIRVLFGESYVKAASVLVTITAAMALLSLNFLIFSAFLAKSLFHFLPPTYVVIIATVMIVYLKFHSSSNQIAQAILIGSAGLLAINLFIIIKRYFFLTKSNQG